MIDKPRMIYQQAFTLFSLLFLVLVPALTVAEEPSWTEDLKAGVTEGLKSLGVEAGKPNLCVITNAPYVRVGEKSAVACLDTIRDASGCSEARGNLLFFHAALTGPLRVVLFHKKTSDGVVLTLAGGANPGERMTDPCSPITATSSKGSVQTVKLRLGGDEILNPEKFKEVIEKLGPSEAFSITSILNAWADGAPFQFLKACEFHNHYCPGVIGGYLIVQLLLEKYPLKKGHKYVWIGAPPKCGDDAIQILLDLTPGKRTCFIKGLTPSQKKRIKVEEPLNNVQGALIIWDNKANQGNAVVFKYHWAKACKIAGLKYSDFLPPAGPKDPRFFTTRLQANRALMPYLDKPSELVSVAKEVTVTPEMYVKMISAGSNPYEVIGLTAE